MNRGVNSGMSPSGKTNEGKHGSCVHKLVRDAKDPDIVYMQNHWGIYRRRRGTERWTDISKGLPQKNAWFTVLREGLATDGAGPAETYVGATTGHL